MNQLWAILKQPKYVMLFGLYAFIKKLNLKYTQN